MKKEKYRFLLKFLGYSLVLFAFGHQLLHGYTWLLGYGMNIADSTYRVPPYIEKFLYGSSMVIIAFCALIIATPSIAARKKAGIIAIGLIGFFLTDLLFVQLIIFPQGLSPSSADSPAFEVYLCIKWILPFLLWIIQSYAYLGELFNPKQEAE
ncbi:MAG: hypothetical protein ACLPN1_03345 [Dissulfurispiraceae bacterium]